MNMSTRMTTMVGNGDHKDDQRHQQRRRNHRHRRRRRRYRHRHRRLWYAPRSLPPFPPSYLPTCTLPPPYLPTFLLPCLSSFLTSHLPALLPPYLPTPPSYFPHPLNHSTPPPPRPPHHHHHPILVSRDFRLESTIDQADNETYRDMGHYMF